MFGVFGYWFLVKASPDLGVVVVGREKLCFAFLGGVWRGINWHGFH